MKAILAIFSLLLAVSARAVQFDIVTYPYLFVSLSGNAATGTVPVSETDYTTGTGPHYWAGDRSNNPFVFGFNTPSGDVYYLDYFGFGFTLSDDRNYLYANGSIAQMAFGGGLVSVDFITGADGITLWNGSFQAGGRLYTASGTGTWLREGFDPSATPVPDYGSTLVLMILPVSLLYVLRQRHGVTPSAAWTS